jgi:signal peptidase I
VFWAVQWVVVGGLVLAIFLGWVGAVMVSGNSMLPGLRNGDIVLFSRASAYQVGDIAVFEIPEGVGQGQSVIHRIVDGSSAQGWTFQGDNRDLRDPWLVRDEHIRGTPRFVIPGGTAWLRWAAERSPYVVAGLLTLMVAIATFPTREKKDDDADDADDASAATTPPPTVPPPVPSGTHPAPAPPPTLPPPRGRA